MIPPIDATRQAQADTELRGAGLRVTRPRVLVYAMLRAAGGHRSVDEVVALLRKDGNELPRMSVYNVVADLEAAGLLMCADVGPGRTLYEAAATWHHHFVCRACGEVTDVPCRRGRKPCLRPPLGFRAKVDEARVVYRGVCEACQREKNSTNRT